jgi:hypothetical protein
MSKELEVVVKNIGVDTKVIDSIYETGKLTLSEDFIPEYYPTWYGREEELNPYGYRSDNFTGSNGFVFLGCSLTMGAYLEKEEVWPWIVGKHFGVKVWNLAQSGRGDDDNFINAHNWIPKLKPKVVCMLLSPPGRHSVFSEIEDIEEFHLYRLPKKPKFPWLYDEKYLFVSQLRNVLAIKSICDENNIPFILESSSDLLSIEWEGLAKDNSHPGKVWHEKISLIYIKQIEKCI